MQAEATLSSLNFSFDSFTHDDTPSNVSAINRGMESRRSIDWEMKILDTKDGSHSPPLYLISLPKEDGGQ